MVYGSRLKRRSIAVMCLTATLLLFIPSWLLRCPRGESESAVSVGLLETGGTSATLNQSGYLVILNIPEQLLSGMSDFVQLYMVNQMHWKLRMIEPYVLGSRLAFVPPVTEDFRSLPTLSTYFNRSHMLHNMKGCFQSVVELNTFEDFLINAAREFIVLKFVTEGTFFLFDEDIYECSFLMKETEHLLNYHLQKVKEKAIAIHGPNYQFVGIYSVCVRCGRQKHFSMLQAVEYVKQWMIKTMDQYGTKYIPRYTVVVPEWKCIRNHPTNYCYYDRSFTTLNLTQSCHLQTTLHSLYVTNAARTMLATLALPRPLVALHVRSERIASKELQHDKKGFIDNCLTEISRVLQAVQRKYNVSRDHIIFTHDGSDYGSTSMWGGRRGRSRYIISKIQALGIRNVQYKPVNQTSIDLAAAQFIEKEILVSADILILAGFGAFQSSLLTRFSSKAKGGGKWYKVCSDEPKKNHLSGLAL